MANEIIKVDVSPVLDWGDVASATAYHCRLSKYYDFSVIEAESSVLATSTYSPTLTGGDSKYYWQWRAYVGGAWLKWNEVQSFTKITGGADLTIADGKWMMFEDDERADYTLIFTSAPQYNITESQVYRTSERNLAGDLLSEFYTTKGKMTLDFGENNTISVTEKNQILRYYGMVDHNIYLACAPYNGVEYYRNIWKISFVSEPVLQPLNGNEERFIITLDLEEV